MARPPLDRRARLACMRRIELAVAALALGGGLWGASCGGSVKVESDGSGGSGASSMSSSMGATGAIGASGGTAGAGGITTTTTTSSSSSTGVGGGPSDICQGLCAALQQCGGTEPGCVDSCLNEANGECGFEFLEAVGCMAKTLAPPACDVTPCLSQLDQYQACTQGGCEDQGCYVGPDTSCGCAALCFGSSYSTECKLNPNGPYDCSCFIDGMPVGFCNDFQPEFVCDVELGCCGQIFFDFDG